MRAQWVCLRAENSTTSKQSSSSSSADEGPWGQKRPDSSSAQQVQVAALTGDSCDNMVIDPAAVCCANEVYVYMPSAV